MSSLVSTLLEEVRQALRPLIVALDDPWVLERLLAQLGTDPATVGGTGFLDAIRAVRDATQRLEELQATTAPSLAEVLTAVVAVSDTLAAARALTSADPATHADLGVELLELLTLRYLAGRTPLLYQLAVMLGVVEVRVLPELVHDGVTTRVPVPVDHLVLERLQGLLTDPVRTVRDQIPAAPLATRASADATADLVVARIRGVLSALGIPWMYGYPPEDAVELGDAAPYAAHALLAYAPAFLVPDPVMAGICIALSSAEDDDLGVVITPFGELNLQRELPRWNVAMGVTAEVEAIAVGGGVGFRILASPGTTHAVASFEATQDPTDDDPFVIGAAEGTRLEVLGARFHATADLSETRRRVELGVEVEQATFVLTADGADGFLRAVLGEREFRARLRAGNVLLERGRSQAQGRQRSRRALSHRDLDRAGDR